MTIRLVALLLFVPFCLVAAFAQATVLIDPVCPVTSFSDPLLPNATKQLRIMYFPAAQHAKLKDPQSLTLNIGFNDVYSKTLAGRNLAVPFVRTGDRWEATVDASKAHAMYVIFSISDDQGRIDDNGGSFWDLVFCDEYGRKDLNGARAQARSYTGVNWSDRLRRQQDYSRAIATLEHYMDPTFSRTRILLQDSWSYRVERDGGDAQAWMALAKLLEQFVTDHLDNQNALSAAGEFVIQNQDKFPSEIADRIVTTLDARTTNAQPRYRARLEYTRAVYQRDPRKRLAAFDAVVSQYPESSAMEGLQLGRFQILHYLGDFSGAEAAFLKYQEVVDKQHRVYNLYGYAIYLDMAGLYIDRGVKLDEAFKLIDQAQSLTAGAHMPPGLEERINAESALARAGCYLAMHKPGLALGEAQKAFDLRNNAESNFVLAQALAATGDKKGALESYFQAAMLPSNDDLKHVSELKKFYVKNHFGKEKEFEGALEAQRLARFRAAQYVPQLVDEPAPAFEFVTLTGEKFDAPALASKVVVVNFWSPG